MPQAAAIVFVCEHGAAKSVIAATYFNKLADEIGSGLRAIARGTNPDQELSSQALHGLLEDGLTPVESFPHRLTVEDIQSAHRVISFCELPPEYQQTNVELWDGIPAISENYEKARDAIIERIRQLLNQ